MADYQSPARPASYDKKVGLVLQGGGALGSYQAGVYEALAASEYCPDWVAGISIGAINAAIIAGNAPEHRVDRLRTFWEDITAPTAWWLEGLTGPLATWQRSVGGMSAIMFGQPGFFAPRKMHEWFSPTLPTSYYATSALKETLERLVDFDRINHAKEMRLSVGAVNVRSGRFAYFDSAEIVIRPEHVMASGSLPPGFPPVEIDGELYWDGGLVSNTPLQYVLDHSPRRSRLTFQVDVFQGRGQLPTNLEEVSEREKDIRYSSRTRITTENFRYKHEVRHAINELMEILPPDIRNTEQCQASLGIRLRDRDGHRAAHLSPARAARRTQGLRVQPRHDERALEAGALGCPRHVGRGALARADTKEVGVRVFDVMHDILAGKAPTTQTTPPMEGPPPDALPHACAPEEVKSYGTG